MDEVLNRQDRTLRENKSKLSAMKKKIEKRAAKLAEDIDLMDDVTRAVSGYMKHIKQTWPRPLARGYKDKVRNVEREYESIVRTIGRGHMTNSNSVEKLDIRLEALHSEANTNLQNIRGVIYIEK